MSDNYSMNSDSKSGIFSRKNADTQSTSDQKSLTKLVIDDSTNQDKRNSYPGQDNISPSKKYNINSRYHNMKSMNEKYLSSKHEFLEEEFKKNTTGLVSGEEFKRRKDNLDKGISDFDATKAMEKDLLKKREFAIPQKSDEQNFQENIDKKKILQKKKKHLSFIDDIEENSSSSEDSQIKIRNIEPEKKLKKDP